MFRNLMMFGLIPGILYFILTAGNSAQLEVGMSIGQRFHYETSFGDEGYKGTEIGWGEKVPLYKKYEVDKKIVLPAPELVGMNVEKAIRTRRSVRYYADQPVTPEQLSQILLSANGITEDSDGWEFRAAPSGGALYPVEIYVVVSNVDTIADGLYHFQVSDSSLEMIRKGNLDKQLHLAANEQEAVGSSALTLVLTARFNRSTTKYGDRGYRYTYIEAGAVCENVYLQANSLGLGTVAIGAFNDDMLNRFLEIDGLDEAALLIMPIGYPR